MDIDPDQPVYRTRVEVQGITKSPLPAFTTSTSSHRHVERPAVPHSRNHRIPVGTSIATAALPALAATCFAASRDPAQVKVAIAPEQTYRSSYASAAVAAFMFLFRHLT